MATNEPGMKVEDTKKQAQEKAGEMIDKTEQKARDMASQAQEQAKSTLESQKDRAASELGNIANAFRQTSTELRNQNNDTVARYTDKMAEQVNQLSSYMESHNVEQFMRDAESFARRQPELFLGGAFALGLLAARFMKSSPGTTQGGQSQMGRPQSMSGQRNMERTGYQEMSGYPTSERYETTPGRPAAGRGYGGSTGRETGTGPETRSGRDIGRETSRETGTSRDIGRDTGRDLDRE